MRIHNALFHLVQVMPLKYKSTENLMVFVTKHNVRLFSLFRVCVNSCPGHFCHFCSNFCRTNRTQKCSHTHRKNPHKQKLACAHAYKSDRQIDKKNNVAGLRELMEKQQIAYKILKLDENTK